MKITRDPHSLEFTFSLRDYDSDITLTEAPGLVFDPLTAWLRNTHGIEVGPPAISPAPDFNVRMSIRGQTPLDELPTELEWPEPAEEPPAE